ncbi:diacylglycerol/lipid kinase family protein [Streptomyces beigongshangae]|uniref:diacylglycerol/lipid kinase family protein n=1 Tax=Streptomyces beigongshangae TaxID=2841597 RepID=UPI001C8587D9|nr:diacylglycerol kinase family protein [Streptomyces sp. REN17]
MTTHSPTDLTVPARGTRPPRGALIVANPTAGTFQETHLTELTELCRVRPAPVEVRLTGGRGEATATVRDVLHGSGARPDLDLVIAVGGDGTVREVAEGLTEAGRTPSAALFIVPLGTGNSGYRALWGVRPWQEALSAVLTGDGDRAVVRRLDLARLAQTGAPVLLGACSGLVAQALATARTLPLTGHARYRRAYRETAEAFVPYPGRVTVDGTVLHEGGTVLANVGGGRHRGGQYLLLPRSELDDGLLDVCVIGDEVAPADVPELTRDGEHLGRPGVHYGRGRRITVERLDGRPLVFEHDGELQQERWDRMTLEVLPHALPVWCASGAATGPGRAHADRP